VSESEPPASRCLNCDHPLPDPRPNFCPQCGQETVLRPPRLGEFLQQWGGAFVSTEGALWRTLWLLVLKPGELTRQYLAGRRKHYVLPLRLYLTISVIVLLLIRVAALSADSRAVVVEAEIAPSEDAVIDLGWASAGRRAGVFFCEGLPAWVCERVQTRLLAAPEAFRREMAGIGERIVANLGAAMFLLLPSFALFTMLAYRNRRLRYTEHLVFALHLHAYWFIAIALMLPEFGPLSALAALSVPAHTMLALGRVFGDRRWTRLLRVVFIATLYGSTLGVVMAGLLLYAVLA
jgi:hypothetical protein